LEQSEELRKLQEKLRAATLNRERALQVGRAALFRALFLFSSSGRGLSSTTFLAGDACDMFALCNQKTTESKSMVWCTRLSEPDSIDWNRSASLDQRECVERLLSGAARFSKAFEYDPRI
jgi:hypothetical protein